jgi:hypothetical protein
MPVIQLKLEGDGAFEDLQGREVIQVSPEAPLRIAVLPGGMESGEPSVAITFDLPDGRAVVAETSLNGFQAAARATAARYGWAADREAGITPIDGSRRTQ